jgi:hypothetical protein
MDECLIANSLAANLPIMVTSEAEHENGKQTPK